MFLFHSRKSEKRNGGELLTSIHLEDGGENERGKGQYRIDIETVIPTSTHHYSISFPTPTAKEIFIYIHDAGGRVQRG